MATTTSRGASIKPVGVTPAERRIAKALAMEPGGPPSPQARIANKVIRTFMKSVWEFGPDSDAGLIQVFRATELMSLAQRVPRGVAITPQRLGRPSGTEWVRAGAPDERKVFLYLHGGGYFFGSPRLYRPFNWRLSVSTGRPVLALDYRLVPEHTPTDALEDALAAYDFLLGRGYKGEDIVVGGDSAGGHLTLALLLSLKAQEKPLPRAAICLSPWVDLLCAAESHTSNKRSDSLIPAAKLSWLGKRYCEGKEETDALFSPHTGDFAGMPPMMFIASGAEILRDDVRHAAERARSAGVTVVHQEWEGLVHVFPVFADYIPEGKAAFRHIAEFLRGVEG